MPLLRALRRTREHCDVWFWTTDGAEFWAHRFVLAARSRGCGAFFSGCDGRVGFVVELMPVREDIALPPVGNVVVSGLSSEMLELVIDFAFHVPIHGRVGVHNVREVLDVSEALNIAKLRDHCLLVLKWPVVTSA